MPENHRIDHQLSTLAWARIRSVPALPHQSERPETGRVRGLHRRALQPALTAAHATGATIAVIWHRPTPRAQIQVHVGGGLVEANGALAYPPGTVTEPVDGHHLLNTLSGLPVWLPIEVSFDGTHDTREHSTGREQADDGAGLEQLLQHLGDQPFAWLSIAEPITTQRTQAALDDAHYEHTPHADDADKSLRAGLKARHLRAWHTELAQTLAAGRWNAQFAVAGTDLSPTRRAARLLSACGDLHQIAYRLKPCDQPTNFAEILTRAGHDVSPKLLTAIARPPIREIPGVRMIEHPHLDLTPETEGPIGVGAVLDSTGTPVGELRVSTATLNRHVLVAGATGSGKTQTVRHLLGGLHQHDVPWLVIEPAKAEYAALTRDLPRNGGVVLIRPGNPDTIPISLTPLTPEPGFPLQTHLDLIRALFLAAFDAAEPFPQVLSQALTACYQQAGWDLVTGEPTHPGGAYWPTLTDLQNSARHVIATIGYGRELAADVTGFVDVRLNSLRVGGAATLLEGGHPIDVAALLDGNVIVELEDLGDDQDKAFVIGALLLRLVQHLRVRQRHHPSTVERLRHVTVIEEAHRLLRAPTPTAAGNSSGTHAVELFAALLAEIRAYGEGIIIAEQIPTKIMADVVKNTALKILHRLPAADDRDLVGAAMNLDPTQSRHVVSLRPGHAVTFADGMDRPIHIAVPATTPTHHGGGVAPVLTAVNNPATLRTLNTARIIAADPRLIMFVELHVIAHLTGGPRPLLTEPARLELHSNGWDPTHVQLAVQQLSTNAVRRRHHSITPWYQPHQLAEHVTHDAVLAITHWQATCQPQNSTDYLAGRYRLTPILRALQQWSGDPTEPHPGNPHWVKTGITLPVVPITDQIAFLHRHRVMRHNPAELLLGTAPVIADALDHMGASPDTDYRTAILEQLISLPETSDSWWADLSKAMEHQPEQT